MPDDCAVDQISDILRDVGRMVADPFQIARDTVRQNQRFGHGARVRRRRARDHTLNDLHVQAVQLIVASDHRSGLADLETDQRVETLFQHLPSHPPHLHELSLKVSNRKIGQS